MSEGIEKAKDKIKKLLNLANDAGAFEGEIDNALRFARRMMLEHNITEGDLENPKTPEEIAAQTEYAQAKAYSHGESVSTWECNLMTAICRLIGTVGSYRTHTKLAQRTEIGTLIFENGKEKIATQIVFYGPVEDAKDATILFHEWTHIIAAMSRLKYGGCFRGDGRAYAEGFVNGILENIQKIREEEKKEIAYTGAALTGNALMILNSTSLMTLKKEKGSEWLRKEAGVKLSTSRRAGNWNDPNAYGAGKSDGKNSNFTRARTLKIGG